MPPPASRVSLNQEHIDDKPGYSRKVEDRRYFGSAA